MKARLVITQIVRLVALKEDVELVGAGEVLGNGLGCDVVFLIREQDGRTRLFLANVDVPAVVERPRGQAYGAGKDHRRRLGNPPGTRPGCASCATVDACALPAL